MGIINTVVGARRKSKKQIKRVCFVLLLFQMFFCSGVVSAQNTGNEVAKRPELTPEGKNDLQGKNHVDFTIEEKAWIKQHPQLKVGTYHAPPYIYVEFGEPKGYLVDIVRQVFEHANLTPEFTKTLPLKTQLEMLRANKIDVGVGFIKTEAREKFLHYTRTPMDLQIGIFTRNDGPEYLNEKSLNGLTIASYHGYGLAEKYMKKYQDIKIVNADDPDGMMKLVFRGRADVAFQEVASANFMIFRSNYNNLVLKGYLPDEFQISTMVTNKNQPLLKSILEKSYQAIPFSQLYALHEKWLGPDFSAEQKILTREELAFLNNKKTFTVCDYNDMYPISGVQNDQLIGVMGDYYNEIASRLNVKFKAIPTSNKKELSRKVAGGKCDFVSVIPADRPPFPAIKRSDQFAGSIYLSMGNLKSIFFDQDSDFEGHTFIVRCESFKQALKKAYPNLDIEVSSDMDRILEKLSFYENVHYIAPKPILDRIIQKYGYQKFKINGSFEKAKIKYALGVHDKNPLLLSIVNKTIATIPSDLTTRIFDKYELRGFRIEKSYNIYFLYLVAALLILMFVALFVICHLKKQHKIIESEKARFETLMQNASDGILIIDKDASVLDSNLKIQQMLGYTADEMKALKVYDFNRFHKKGWIIKTLHSIITKNRQIDFKAEYTRKDGSSFPVGITSTPIVLDNQNCSYSSIRDISEQVEKEKALTDSEFRWKFAIEGSRDGLWDWNVKTAEVYFSPQWKKMLGFKDHEIQGTLKEWKKLVHPEDMPQVMQDITDHFEGRTQIFINRHRVRTKSDNYKWILDRGVIVSRDEQGNPERMLGTHTDISRQKETEEKLEAAMIEAQEANRSKSVFLSNMSHELRTPLNAILGYTQIFADDQTLTKKQLSGIQTMQNAGEHLLMLINDMLDLSKIEAGKLEIQPSEIELKAFITHLCDFIRVRSDSKNIEFYHEISQHLPDIIIGDELRIRQILLNLISNAVKFTDKGYCSFQINGKTVSEGKTKLNFIVEDSGPGIDKSQQEIVFKPFSQSGERLKYSEGTGLGLTVSRNLIELMGGELILTSPIHDKNESGFGPGTRFTFSIVVASEYRKMLQKCEPGILYSFPDLMAGSKKVLIVDDQFSNRVVLRDTLESFGFAVSEAKDGGQALSVCKKVQPDLVFMDLRMPGVDGFMGVKLLSEDERCAKIPVIAITASMAGEDYLKEKCYASGFAGFLPKPFVKQDLIQMVADILDLSLKCHIEAAESDEEIVAPPQEVLEQLWNYLLDGDLDAISDTAQEIETTESGRYREFSKRLQELTNDIQFNGIERLLDQYLEK